MRNNEILQRLVAFPTISRARLNDFFARFHADPGIESRLIHSVEGNKAHIAQGELNRCDEFLEKLIVAPATYPMMHM